VAAIDSKPADQPRLRYTIDYRRVSEFAEIRFHVVRHARQAAFHGGTLDKQDSEENIRSGSRHIHHLCKGEKV